MPSTWKCPATGKEFFTGAYQTPRHRLLAAAPYIPLAAPPPQVAYVPKFRSMFGNSTYGCCVSSEEAFSKTCVNPEIFNSQAIVDQLSTVMIAWARSHGVLNGASLDEVLDWMYQKGYQIGSQLYNDGSKQGVDYTNEIVLQSAIAQGPVKIAIAASQLPSGTGSRDGVYALNGNSRGSDHSVTFCGYGPAEWLYQQLNVPMPSALTGLHGYLVYSWSTIVFVGPNWAKNVPDEAWVRNPTTIGVPPLTPPTPPGPAPIPHGIRLQIPVTIPAGNYVIYPTP